jgi:tetratricopeptide (TPR) repeat protein
MAEYSSKDIRKLTGLPHSLVRALARGGHIAPESDGETSRYSAADVVVLQIAAALRAAGVPAKRVLNSLADIRAQLPLPTGRTSTAAEKRAPVGLSIRPRLRADKVAQAEEHFQAALALEDTDVAAARGRYLAALKAYRHHIEARINLGRLLHLDGQLQEAEQVYRATRYSNALLSFNLALLLEDTDRHDEAVLAYRQALGLDPSLHDAHYNLSRLHERARRPREALHHLLAYRRHVTQPQL